MANVQLVLISTPELAEALHDWLLQRDRVERFNEQAVLGHSRALSGLSTAEEVRAHQKQVMFCVVVDADLARQLLRDIEARWPGAAIDYWMTPIVEAGTLGRRPPDQK